MKRFFILIMVVGLCACKEEAKQDKKKDGLLSTDMVSNPYSATGLDTSAYNSLPTMDFTDTLHNFGWINEGERAVYSFEFKNNGRKPLIISDASGSCGCTIADFPKEPVPPGATSKIDVEFNATDKQGHQEKSVSIITNSQVSIHRLYIKADVKSSSN